MLLNRNQKEIIGKKGEDLACQFLINLGYEILERNWFNRKGKRLGELDIIAKNGQNKIIFVEIKTRYIKNKNLKNDICPEEQVTIQKLNKLQKIAETYISEKNLWENDWQFDAISIIFYSNNQKSKIEHFENIFF